MQVLARRKEWGGVTGRGERGRDVAIPVRATAWLKASRKGVGEPLPAGVLHPDPKMDRAIVGTDSRSFSC